MFKTGWIYLNIFEKLEDLLISDPSWLESNQSFMFDSLFDFMQDILNPTVSVVKTIVTYSCCSLFILFFKVVLISIRNL